MYLHILKFLENVIGFKWTIRLALRIPIIKNKYQKYEWCDLLNTHNLTNYFKQVVFCAKSLETECPTDGALNVLRHSVDVYYLRHKSTEQ